MTDNTQKGDSSEKKPGSELLRLLGTASTVGINLVVSTFIGFAIGYYLLDRFLNTFPWFTAIFTLIGIAAGFKYLFKIASKASDNKDSGRDNEGSRGQGVK
ncbi:MAG: AtpZ/AtpI family protein [Nitrospirae bacterium]|nr:AtpZ/AtpI family protein [Nitrospirota bacterium]